MEYNFHPVGLFFRDEFEWDYKMMTSNKDIRIHIDNIRITKVIVDIKKSFLKQIFHLPCLVWDARWLSSPFLF